MNGRKAKRIRRAVYGEQSLRQKRVYVVQEHGMKPIPGAIGLNGQPAFGMCRTIKNKPGSLREIYQRAKKVLV